MPKTQKADALTTARGPLDQPLDFSAFLAKLSPKDRLNAERHAAECDADADSRHGEVWRRMACTLATLAPHSVKLNRRESLQFYVADGKYRMQVFALEDRRDGTLNIYCGNVLDQATRSGLLARRKAGAEPDSGYMVAASRENLIIEQLDGSSPNPADFFKDMLGWNRRAIRILLPVTASESQIRAVESLCALSVQGKGKPQVAKAN